MTGTDTHTPLRKLFRKPAVLLAAVIISGTILVALLAYVLAPDTSPNANRMIVELGAKAPGYTQRLLLLPRHRTVQPEQHWYQWFSGRPDDYRYLPLNDYRFEGPDVIVTHFIDEGLQDTLRYALRDLLPEEQLQKTLDLQRRYISEHLVLQHRFILGSDRYGRDILSRLLIGSRVSIAVGLIAVVLSLSIGTFLGAIAGYFGGWVDNAVMFVINIFWSVPTLLLVFAITLTIGKGFWEIFIAIGLTMWVGAARLIRGQVLVLREMEYITAARAIGTGHLRIIFRHIIPNIAGPLMVVAAGNFATAILIEAGLSFLGIGIQPPQPSWGLMIKEHYNFLITNQPMSAIIPGIAIMLLVYAFNILGNALRDLLDVRSR